MIDISQTENHFPQVDNFEDLISIPLQGSMNAVCWKRSLVGDFQEIVSKVEMTENIMVISEAKLREFHLSDAGSLARDILINDMKLLTAHGADPIINVIKCYDRDDSLSSFPTDVYSYHVDRSPIPTDTFLVTYYGAASDILLNSQAIQKIQDPEIRNELMALHEGTIDGFGDFLEENYFDLHYLPLPDAQPINLGVGHLWRLATDHPDSTVLPCIHRAPIENKGENRLMLIC